MKPGVSLQRTAACPPPRPTRTPRRRRPRRCARVRTISTSGISGAGLKKCMPDHALGTLGRRRDLGDRERGGVRREDRVRRDDALELGEELVLGLELLDDRLDHEVAVREVGELGGRAQAAERPRRARRRRACPSRPRAPGSARSGRAPARRARRSTSRPTTSMPACAAICAMPGAHRPETDDADRADLHAGDHSAARSYRCRTPRSRHVLDGASRRRTARASGGCASAARGSAGRRPTASTGGRLVEVGRPPRAAGSRTRHRQRVARRVVLGIADDLDDARTPPATPRRRGSRARRGSTDGRFDDECARISSGAHVRGRAAVTAAADEQPAASEPLDDAGDRHARSRCTSQAMP